MSLPTRLKIAYLRPRPQTEKDCDSQNQCVVSRGSRLPTQVRLTPTRFEVLNWKTDAADVEDILRRHRVPSSYFNSQTAGRCSWVMSAVLLAAKPCRMKECKVHDERHLSLPTRGTETIAH